MGFIRQPLPQDVQDQSTTFVHSSADSGELAPVELSSVSQAKKCPVSLDGTSTFPTSHEDHGSDMESTPRLHGNRSYTPQSSCASTDSGPPSPGHVSLQCSPAMGPEDLRATRTSMSGATLAPSADSAPICAGSGSAFHTSKEKPQGSSLPEYHIHREREPHPKGQPVLRVHGTFVEYWDPPSNPHTSRRSHSSPASNMLASEPSLPPSLMLPSPEITPRQMSSPQGDSPPPPVFDPEVRASLQPSESHTPSSQSETNWEPERCWLPPPTTVLCLAGELQWFYETPPPQWAASETALQWMPPSQLFDAYAQGWQVPSQNLATDPPNFYGLSQAAQMPSASAAAWHQDGTAGPSNHVGRQATHEENGRRSVMSEDGVATVFPMRAPQETKQMNSHRLQTGARVAGTTGAKESVENGRRGSGFRKTPMSDEKWTFEIITVARTAFNENRQDTSIWELSHQNKHSSANVQNALEIAAQRGWESDSEVDWNDAWAMVAALRGRARQAYESPFANFVLSKLFEVMPTAIVSCLAGELQGVAVDAAKHRFGCRCMVRLIRYHAQNEAADECVSQVIKTLLGAAQLLSHAQFGTHVVQELIDSGTPEHRRMVARAFTGSLHSYSRNRFACRAVEKLVAKCAASDVNAIMDELLSGPDSARQLLAHEFGVRVVKTLLGSEHGIRAAEKLCAVSADTIISARGGRLLLQEAHALVSRAGGRAGRR